MSHITNRPEATRAAIDSMRGIRTPEEVQIVAAAELMDFIRGKVDAAHANVVSSLCGRINDASFLRSITDRAKATSGENGLVAGIFDAMLTVTRSNGKSNGEKPREPAHPTGRANHERQLERELDEIEAKRRAVESELANLRSEEYATAS